MSRNCRMPASAARYRTARVRNPRFSRTPPRSVARLSSAASAVSRSTAKLSLPPGNNRTYVPNAAGRCRFPAEPPPASCLPSVLLRSLRLRLSHAQRIRGSGYREDLRPVSFENEPCRDSAVQGSLESLQVFGLAAGIERRQCDLIERLGAAEKPRECLSALTETGHDGSRHLYPRGANAAGSEAVLVFSEARSVRV